MNRNISNVIKIRGMPEAVLLAKADVLEIKVIKQSREINSREIGIVLGKGGKTVNKIASQHSVVVEINESNKELTLLEIFGYMKNTESALAEIEDILYQNEEIVLSVQTSQLVRRSLLNNSAQILKKLQTKAQEDCTSSVFLIFDKVTERGEHETANINTHNLLVKAPRCCVTRAYEITKNEIDKFESSIKKISVPNKIIPFIIGKKGNTVNEMRKSCPSANVDIEIERGSGEIQILADDEEAQNFIIAEINNIVSQNQTSIIEVEKYMLIIFFGPLGKEVRDRVSNSIGVYLEKDKSNSNIVLRGSVEKVCHIVSHKFSFKNHSKSTAFKIIFCLRLFLLD